jgi:ribosomal protein S19E (S16A)
MNALAQIGVLEPMPEGKKGGRRLTKQGQQDIDRIAKEIFESKQ